MRLILAIVLLCAGCSVRAKPTMPTASQLKARGYSVFDLPRQTEAAIRRASRLQDRIVNGEYDPNATKFLCAFKESKGRIEVVFIATVETKEVAPLKPVPRKSADYKPRPRDPVPTYSVPRVVPAISVPGGYLVHIQPPPGVPFTASPTGGFVTPIHPTAWPKPR